MNARTLDLVPSHTEVRDALRDTNLLLKLRWRLVRSNTGKSGIWVGLTLLMGALFLASNVGTLIRQYAEEGINTAAGTFATNYVVALDRGDLGTVGATALGSAMAVSLFAPFTGASMSALTSPEDLFGLRPTRLHRYFDSIITTGFSTIGFLQLFALTGVGSLLTLNGGRPAGLLFTWSVWPVLVLATVAEGWAIELIYRSFGPNFRKILGFGLLAILGAVLLSDPNHGKTLFGLGDQFVNTLNAASEHNSGFVVKAAAITTASILVLFMVGIALSRAALARPATSKQIVTDRKRRLPLSKNPNIALTQLLFAQVLRTSDIRRPLLTVFVVGIPATWINGSIAATTTTMVVAVPLSVALAFGINTFGVLGPGMSWLASQPNLMRNLLYFTVSVQIAITIGLSALIWFPATVFGHADTADIAAIAAGTVVATLFTTRSAASKSVNRPYLTKLDTRGNMIVPPLTAINYTIRFALWSGQLGVLVMNQDSLLRMLLVAAAITWTSLRFIQLFRLWSDRDVQSFVVKQVAAA